VAEAKVTERELDAERERYRPVAYRGSLLFFSIADLSGIDPMYQYSLQMFTGLFRNAILKSEHPADAEDIAAGDAQMAVTKIFSRGTGYTKHGSLMVEEEFR
jgi:hypothetical protein